MKILLSFFILSFSLIGQVKFQEPTIPADQGKTYNEIVKLKESDPDAAIARINKLPKDYSSAFDFVHALILIEHKQENKAVPHLQTALKKLPTFYQARLALAQVYLNGNEFKKALPELIEIVKLGRADGQLWKLISSCHLELKNNAASEAALTQAKIFLPQDKSLDEALLNIYLNQGDFFKAEKLSEKLLDENKDNEKYWRIFIQCLMENKKHKAALLHQEIFNKLFKATESDLKLLADMYFNEGIYLKAASLYLKVEGKLSGRSALQAAKSYSYVDEHEKVVGILKSVQALSPAEKAEFYTLKGQAFLKLNKSKEALSSLTEASKFDSQNHYIHYYIAEIYENLKEFNKALDYYTRASKASNLFVSSKLRKATIYIELDQKNSALNEVLEVRTVDKSATTESFYNYLKNSQ